MNTHSENKKGSMKWYQRKVQIFGRETFRQPAMPIAIFILMAMGIAVTGYLSYKAYEKQFRSQVERQLSAIAELKMNELLEFRTIWMKDAEFLSGNAAFAELANRVIEDPADAQAQKQFQAWLETIKTYQYERIYLLDADAVERSSAPDNPEPADTQLALASAEVFRTKQITIVDFYNNTNTGDIRLAILVPIPAKNAKDRPAGILVMRIDPAARIYPFISEWPIANQTAETLLMRRDGDTVLFLNNLKFEEDSALNLRIPLIQTEVLAVKAILGQNGILEGVDYHDTPVIADIRPIPNSPWFLITKINTSEVYTPLRARAREIGLVVIALLIGAGILLGMIWRQQRLQLYKSQYEAEESLRKSEEKYRKLIEHASDGIYMADASGKYIDVNPSGCSMLGYTREEILAKRISDLIPNEDLAASPLQLDQLRQEKALLTERRLICKDGSLLSVEISSHMLPDGSFQSIQRNITERKQTEENIRRYTTRLEEAEKHANLGSWEFNTITGQGWWSKQMYRMFNFEISDTVPDFESYLERIHPEDRGIVQDVLVKMSQGAEPLSQEFRNNPAYGQSRYFLPTVHTERNAQGKPIKFIGTQLDITDRKIAIEALRESKERFEAIIAASGVATWDWNVQTGETVFNERWAEIIGYTLEELEPISIKTWAAMAHPDDLKKSDLLLEKHFNGETESYEFESRMKHKSGEWVWVLDRGKILTRAGDGTPLRMLGTHTDITERKRMEETLRASETRNRAIINAVPDLLFEIDRNGIILDYRTPDTSELFAPPEAFLGKKLNAVMPANVARLSMASIEAALKFKTMTMFEYDLAMPGGQQFYEVRNVALSGETVLAVVRNITERRRAGEEIRKLNAELEQRVAQRTEQLESANKELEAFSYSVSHDLRAPLRAVTGYTNILMEDYKPLLDEDGGRVCNVIKDEAHRMGQLIDDLLAFSRLNRKEIHQTTIDMRRMVNEIFNETTTPEAREQINFQVGDLPSAQGDPGLIRQVWINLISNAVKFTSKKDQAFIEVGSIKNKTESAYFIRDNGAGFDMQYAGKLFGVFQRLHGESEFEGTGVGLAIAQRVVLRHGGRIWGEGRVNQGAAFYFTLPEKDGSHE